MIRLALGVTFFIGLGAGLAACAWMIYGFYFGPMPTKTDMMGLITIGFAAILVGLGLLMADDWLSERKRRWR